jgi:hypothetical protein
MCSVAGHFGSVIWVFSTSGFHCFFATKPVSSETSKLEGFEPNTQNLTPQRGALFILRRVTEQVPWPAGAIPHARCGVSLDLASELRVEPSMLEASNRSLGCCRISKLF